MHDHVLELSHINLHAVGVSLCLYSRQMSWVMDRSVITGVGADQSGRGGTVVAAPTTVQAWRPCPLWEPSPSHPILV